jgi:hypothetical protein
MKKDMSLILFWGSLWGIAEATAGLLLHMAAISFPGVPGFFMFPIAFNFMKKAYDSTGKASSIFRVSLVAALIKLADFLFPVSMAIRIINPALSILMEGFTVYLVIKFFSLKKNSLATLFQTFCMGVIWRGLFLIHLLIISLFGLPAALITDGIYYTIRFLIGESFINSLIMYVYLHIEKNRPLLEIRPVYSYCILFLAISVTLML